jgi:hypothetical protein
LPRTPKFRHVGTPAIARPRNRRRLYGLGALGSQTHLEGRADFRECLPGDLSAMSAFIRSGNHLPRPICQKRNMPARSLFTRSSPTSQFTHRRALPVVIKPHCRKRTTWHRLLVEFQQRVRAWGAPPWRQEDSSEVEVVMGGVERIDGGPRTPTGGSSSGRCHAASTSPAATACGDWRTAR